MRKRLKIVALATNRVQPRNQMDVISKFDSLETSAPVYTEYAVELKYS